MNKPLLLLSAFVLLVLMFTVSSCKKEQTNQAPVITLEEPEENTTITMPNSVHIEGKLTDDDVLHEAAILLLNANGDTVLAEYPTVHDKKSYNFHIHYSATVAGVYTVQIMAEDHEEARSNVARTVTVQ